MWPLAPWTVALLGAVPFATAEGGVAVMLPFGSAAVEEVAGTAFAVRLPPFAVAIALVAWIPGTTPLPPPAPDTAFSTDTLLFSEIFFSVSFDGVRAGEDGDVFFTLAAHELLPDCSCSCF